MQTSFRLKIGLFLSGILLAVFAIQSVLPRFLTSFVSFFDSRTTSSCTTRCSDAYNLSLPSDSLVVDFEPLVDTVATEPDPLLFRTGFDSSVVAPPYLFIFIFLMFASIGLLAYYIKFIRPSRFQPLLLTQSRVEVLHYPHHELPAEDIRQHMLLFNRRLPQSMQRREQETMTEWFARIKFPSPVNPHYLEVRYGGHVSIPVHQLTFFKQTTEDFLRHVGSTII
ncbi:hypothetical protein HNY42_08675 [Exiguobacterium sp. Helios]|uniref:hypothetical protein n=1 Tax=Exiguobacterium sp. Helios TaxID=2735868 RepID=UPI00165E2E34|nr:hypothetical protein [Exiguobacterium sp. Helios]QNR21005.1 hypothetical protein HNY42_08675 [Exiguobacterium sp. Helios]